MTSPTPLAKDGWAWEYRVVEFRPPHNCLRDRDLDHYGNAGWELVAVCTQHTSHFAYFKRPSPTQRGET